jgi:hypothetical protein
MQDPALTTPSISGDTLKQIEQQLGALACPTYDVLVLDARSGERRHLRTRLSPQQVLDAAPWLHHENLRDGEILFRPTDSRQVTHLWGVSEPAAQRGGEYGLEPAVVVRGSHGRHEIWLRSSEPLAAGEKEVLDRFLAADFRAATPPPSPGDEFGHLAGFTSPMTKRSAGLDQAPHLTLESTSGQVFSRAPVLVEAARQEVTQATLQARTDFEVAGFPSDNTLFPELDRAYRERSLVPSLPAPGSRLEVEKAVLGLSLARDAYAEANHHFAVAFQAGAPLVSHNEQHRLAESLLNACRRTREAERPLEDMLESYPLPKNLDLQDLSRYGELRIAAQEAVDRSTALERPWNHDPASPANLEEAQHLTRNLSSELATFEKGHGLRSSPGETAPMPDVAVSIQGSRLVEDANELVRSGSLQEEEMRLVKEYGTARESYEVSLKSGAKGQEASSFVAMTVAEVKLESFEFDLRRQVHVLTLAQNHLSENLGRVERMAEQAPAEHMRQYEQHVERLCAIEERIGSHEPQLTRLEAGRLDRDLKRLEPLLLERPNEETLARYATLYDRRLALDIKPLPSSAEQLLSGDELKAAKAQLDESGRHLGSSSDIFLKHPSQRSLDLLQAALTDHSALRVKVGDSELTREYRVAQREMRATLSEISRYAGTGLKVPESALDRWRDALALHNAAETTRAARITSSAPLGSALNSQEALRTLARLRRGDFTPETLARLNRQLSKELKAVSGRIPTPEAPPPAKRDLLQAIAIQRSDRHALLRSARAAAGRSRTSGPPALEHLQKAVARYQGSSAELNRLASQYARGPHRRVLPVAYFLQHPTFQHAPHRAVGAWTAHALRQGLPAHHASELLARTHRARVATPFIASTRFGGLAAALVGRWLARLPERAMLEYVHER